ARAHGSDTAAELAERVGAGAAELVVTVDLVGATRAGGRKHPYVSHVVEVLGASGRGPVVTTELFGPGPDGRAYPRHQPERIRDRLRRVGYDPRALTAAIAAADGGWRAPLLTRTRAR